MITTYLLSGGSTSTLVFRDLCGRSPGDHGFLFCAQPSEVAREYFGVPCLCCCGYGKNRVVFAGKCEGSLLRRGDFVAILPCS
jgi:hypothetical protein